MEENTRTLKYIANKELKKIQLEEGLKEEEEDERRSLSRYGIPFSTSAD